MASKWRKGTDGWYVLANLNLSAVEETGGLYVIWTGPAICLWVGQTENFQDRFREHRRSSETKPLRFDRSGNVVLRVSDYVKMQPMNVFVTWLRKGTAVAVLANLNLSAVEETGGLYVIWTGPAIWVGQTENFQDRFREHRRSSETKPLRFDRSGNVVLRVSDYVKMQPMNVFVTWLPAAVADWEGMERYLYDHYKPELVMRRPEVKPIPVQRPW